MTEPTLDEEYVSFLSAIERDKTRPVSPERAALNTAQLHLAQAREWVHDRAVHNSSQYIRNKAELEEWKGLLAKFNSAFALLETALASSPEHIKALASLVFLVSALESAEPRAVKHNSHARATGGKRAHSSSLNDIIKRHLASWPARPARSANKIAADILEAVNRDLVDAGKKPVKITTVAKRIRKIGGPKVLPSSRKPIAKS